MVESVRNVYHKVLPDNPFDYFFLDDHVDMQYRADQQARKMFGAFALLAIMIACLGIYGLSLFMSGQRKKEMGVRKVLGASSIQNLGILLKDYLVLILLSALVAGPVLYWFGQQWLENFAFRIGWSWWIFLVPVSAILVVTLVTVIGQSLKSALENPVHALRYE
jgi:putative ABC transport system permease protein